MKEKRQFSQAHNPPSALTEKEQHLIESLALEATRSWAESAGIPLYDNSESLGNSHGHCVKSRY